MSKRTLIFIGVAILAMFATYLSYKYDKENAQEPEPEPEPETEANTQPEPEPEPEPKRGRKHAVTAELIPAGNEVISEETAGN